MVSPSCLGPLPGLGYATSIMHNVILVRLAAYASVKYTGIAWQPPELRVPIEDSIGILLHKSQSPPETGTLPYHDDLTRSSW